MASFRKRGDKWEYRIRYSEYGKQKDGSINYIKGANIAGFMRVAKAMLAQGVI